jgi:putative NADH-flavin reductase
MSKPHTDKLARPKSHKATNSASVLIDVTDANIRYATVSGTFLVVGGIASAYTYRNKRVIDVDCDWYQWRPNRGCIRLILRNAEVPYTSNNIGVMYVSNIER